MIQFVNDYEELTKIATIQDTTNKLICYEFENTGVSEVSINGKVIEPAKTYNTGIGFMAIDRTSYQIVFLQPTLIKSLLITRKSIID